jgi:hypothetical protein
LRDNARGGDNRVLVARAPRPEQEAQHVYRGKGVDGQQPKVEVTRHKAFGVGNGHKTHEGRGHDQHRPKAEQHAVGILGNEHLFGHELEAVRQRLQQAVGANFLGPDAPLYVPCHLALNPYQIGRVKRHKDKESYKIPQKTQHFGIKRHSCVP